MRITSFVSVVLSAMAGMVMCSCAQSQQTDSGNSNDTYVSQAIGVDSALRIAESHVGDTLIVSGIVRHTCKHSGRRCFISNEARTAQLRVEASGDINGFNKELIGSTIAVRGVVHELRTKREDIANQLAEIEALKAQGNAAQADLQHCESEMGNLQEKIAEMDSLGRNYYSTFYLDGLTFEEQNQ